MRRKLSVRKQTNGNGASAYRLKPKSVSVRDVTDRLGITLPTVWNWRHGTATRPPLPSTVVQRGDTVRVRIKEAELLGWLRKYRPDLVKAWRT